MAPAAAGTPEEARRALGDEVRRDLGRSPRQLRPRLLYDALGSALFDAICHLPWYGVTRAEKGLLEEHLPRILAAASDPARVIELGCGSGEKIELLGRALVREGRTACVHLVDVSGTALERSTWALERFAGVNVVAHRTTYEEGLLEAASAREAGETLVVLFLGSNLGNFNPGEADRFLGGLRQRLGPGDRLLLGLDLVKPEAMLRLAYDDPLGVTAAFNKNLLVRLNRELGADFDLAAFDHQVAWNAEESRIEMRLVSRRDQEVHIPGAGCRVRLGQGEWIWTESSYKYEVQGISALGERAGFQQRELWIDEEARFALALFRAE